MSEYLSIAQMKKQKYLELFLRNLLLDEKNELHNRSTQMQQPSLDTHRLCRYNEVNRFKEHLDVNCVCNGENCKINIAGKIFGMR